MAENSVLIRDKIEEKYKWDLSPLCTNDDAFFAKIAEAKAMLPALKEFEGKLNTIKAVKEYLELDKKVSEVLEPAEQYCFLKNTECLSSDKYNEMQEKLYVFLSDFSVETAFALSEFYELPDSMLDELIADKQLKDFDRMFKNIKKDKIHKLSKAEEKLLAGMDFLGGFSDNMEKASDVDFDYGEISNSSGQTFKLTQSSYGKFMRSGDRQLRKEAFCKLNGKFGSLINTLACNYINEVKSDCYFAKARKYASALDAALENEEVSKEVYNCLIEQVGQNLPILFDYFKLKQKELNLKDFYIYDAMASTDKGEEKKYTYEEAMQLIKKALFPLGEEYIKLLDKAQTERWIDVYPTLDKRSGAFESGIYGFHPYVMTNFEGDLDSVFTLAHELGHAMHSYYSNKNQAREKANYTIFLAEIASTTNEILLINYLLKEAKSADDKKALYNKLFDEVKGTIFRQTMFAEFEQEVHQLHENGDGLTKDKLCKLYYQLNEKYFGHVKLVDEVQYEWARIPHFFNSFYVYKYATGMLSAICFANKMLSKEKCATENYFKFLSAGCSLEPVEILKNSGCDLSDKKTFENCFEYLASMLNEWKKL